MTLLQRLNVERRLRTIHSWLGVAILPWIVLAGLTGFYLNHPKAVSFLTSTAGAPTPEVSVPAGSAMPVEDALDAMGRGLALYPEETVSFKKTDKFNGRDVYVVEVGPRDLYVDSETGFIWDRGRYETVYVSPEGDRLDRNLRWSRILRSLHERGWVGTALGRWLADITAISLMVFGLSGIYLFVAPRLRRRRNRRARLKAQAASAAVRPVAAGS